MRLRRNKHSVSNLNCHLVFVVKYRRAVIDAEVWRSLRNGFDTAAKRLGIAITEANHDRDHVHVVVEYPPDISVSEIAGALKGTSSFLVRRECQKNLVGKLWGAAFWSPSYFASSCGGAPIEALRLYVQEQGKAPLQGGVSTQKGHRL